MRNPRAHWEGERKAHAFVMMLRGIVAYKNSEWCESPDRIATA